MVVAVAVTTASTMSAGPRVQASSRSSPRSWRWKMLSTMTTELSTSIPIEIVMPIMVNRLKEFPEK